MRKVDRVTVQCAACGKGIERYPAQVAQSRTGRFFCSTECRGKVGGRPKTVPTQQCEQCSAEFVRYGDKRGRFCSKDCQNAWQRRRRVHKVCELCGKDFWLKPSQAAYNVTGRWCSRSCEANSRIKNPLSRTHNGRPAVLDSSGYVRVYEPENPGAYKGGWVAEHRLVAERELGRCLARDEHVHHVNGDKTDNAAENLVVISHGEHSTITGLENGRRLREWAEYRRRFGPL